MRKTQTDSVTETETVTETERVTETETMKGIREEAKNE